jgi:hypothetical protein
MLPPPNKEQFMTDYIADFMKQLHDTHQYAFQHLKVACKRMKAHCDHLANSAEFQEEEHVRL